MLDTARLVWFAVFFLALAGLALYEIVTILRNPPRRFSLRILLLAMTLLAAVFGVFGIVWRLPF